MLNLFHLQVKKTRFFYKFATSLRAWLFILPHLNISCLCGPSLSFFQTDKTAFLIAVLNGLLDVVKCLVKKGANKKAKDEVGTVRTLLSCS
jgi:ankyrin repeat protein